MNEPIEINVSDKVFPDCKLDFYIHKEPSTESILKSKAKSFVQECIDMGYDVNILLDENKVYTITFDPIPPVSVL